MAEGSDEAGNWWGGWMKTVQEKSTNALEQMKKDLGEFGSTIQRDTAHAAASTATLLREQLKVPEDEEDEDVTTTARMKVGFSKLLTGLSQSLTPQEGETRREDDIPSAHRDPHIFDKARARRHAMQTDTTTYCSDPDGHPEFREWLETFNVDSHKGDISDLLVGNTEVRALYTKLVPAAVSHLEFWGRYFYRIQQLDQDEERRKALKERAEMTSSQKFEEEDLGWGDDEDAWDTMPDAGKDQPEVQKFVVLPEDTEHGDAAAGATEGRTQLDKSDVSSESKQTAAVSAPSPDNSSMPMPDSKQDSKSTDSFPDPRNSELQFESKEREPEAKPSSSLDQDSTPSPQLPSTNLKSDTQQVKDLQQIPERPDVNQSMSPSGKPTQSHTVSSTSVVDAPPEKASSSLPARTIVTMAADSSGGVTKDGASQKVVAKGDSPRLDELTVDTSNQQGEEEEEEKRAAAEKVSPVASEGSNRESSLSDDWEKDFDDIEVTEEDLKNASVKMSSGAKDEDDDELDEDWENWE